VPSDLSVPYGEGGAIERGSHAGARSAAYRIHEMCMRIVQLASNNIVHVEVHVVVQI
jgi:hypothetical protein